MVPSVLFLAFAEEQRQTGYRPHGLQAAQGPLSTSLKSNG